VDAQLAQRFNLERLAKESDVVLGTAVTGNPRPSYPDGTRVNTLEFASKPGLSACVVVDVEEEEETAPALKNKKQKRDVEEEDIPPQTPTKKIQQRETPTPTKKTPAKTQKTPVKTPRTTRQSTPTYVEVDEVDSPPPPSSPPTHTAPSPDARDEVIQKLNLELSEMRKKLAAQTTGPTLTEVESTTRLERVQAPVQAQENSLTSAFLAVFKDQAALNREMMREQAAMNRENTATLVAAVLKMQVLNIFVQE